MNRKAKIKALETRLDALTAPKAVSLTQQLISEELENLRADIGNRVSTRGIEKVQGDMASFQEKFKLEPVFEAISKADNDNKGKIDNLQKSFEKQLNDFVKESTKNTKQHKEASSLSRKEILDQIAAIRFSFDDKLTPLLSRDAFLASEVDRLDQEIRRITLLFTSDTTATDAGATVKQALEQALEQTQELEKEIRDLEKRVTSRISSIGNHGDHANRNIAVGSNTSILSRYTDINLIAGTNVTLTATPNNTTKYTDITITASGSGSSTVYNDTVSGTIDGVNKVFVTSSIISSPITLFLSGSPYQAGVDYTTLGSVLTYTTAPDASLSGLPHWLAHT